MTFENIVLENEGSLCIMRINRPDVLNSLNRKLFGELIEAFDEIRRDGTTKVVILTGAGERAFVAGADIAEMKDLSSFEAREFARLAGKAMNRVEDLDRPVIAAINGVALGAGCELAMACDIRIASENAKLGQPEITLGIIPGSGGTQRLPRLIGPSKAKQLVFTGQVIDAQTALRIGLVDVVVPPDQLMSEARKIACAMVEKPRIALALAKKAMNQGLNVDLTTALNYEIECFAQCFGVEDQKERMNAFLEKRKAKFTQS
jgi:enoyl-CoA hydratase